MFTYLVLNGIFILLILMAAAWLKPAWNVRAVLLAVCIVSLLTAVFDPLMIAVGLVEYSPDKLLGAYWLNAPVEDFAYAFMAVPLVAILWHITRGRQHEK